MGKSLLFAVIAEADRKKRDIAEGAENSDHLTIWYAFKRWKEEQKKGSRQVLEIT